MATVTNLSSGIMTRFVRNVQRMDAGPANGSKACDPEEGCSRNKMHTICQCVVSQYPIWQSTGASETYGPSGRRCKWKSLERELLSQMSPLSR